MGDEFIPTQKEDKEYFREIQIGRTYCRQCDEKAERINALEAANAELRSLNHRLSVINKTTGQHLKIVGDQLVESVDENARLRAALEGCVSVFDDMDATTRSDEGDWQHSSYEGVADDARKALKEASDEAE